MTYKKSFLIILAAIQSFSSNISFGSSLSETPPEVKEKILEFLNSKEVASKRITSKEFNKAGKNVQKRRACPVLTQQEIASNHALANAQHTALPTVTGTINAGGYNWKIVSVNGEYQNTFDHFLASNHLYPMHNFNADDVVEELAPNQCSYAEGLNANNYITLLIES